MVIYRKFNKDNFSHINYAHRGLHDISQGIPENSLAAFRAAATAGYGIELDVQLSKDGQVVVFHDDSVKRVCGADGNVCDYTYDELRKMSLLGTIEYIPLFTEVLDLLSGFSDAEPPESGISPDSIAAAPGPGPLIVELKNGKNNSDLCQKTYDILKTYKGVFCIESFNPSIVLWFKNNAPEIFRGQLAQPKKLYYGAVSKFNAWMLSGCRYSFLTRPDFIAYENSIRPARVLKKRAKGVLLFAWTSKEPDIDQAQNDAVIFESYRPAVTF